MLPGSCAWICSRYDWTTKFLSERFLIVSGNCLRSAKQNAGSKSHDLLQASDWKFQTIIVASQGHWREEMERHLISFYAEKLSFLNPTMGTLPHQTLNKP